MSKRYIKFPRQAGIRKDMVTGRYQGLKKINGKQFARTFGTIREAVRWKNALKSESVRIKSSKRTATLGEVWEKMRALHFPSLELSTRRIWERRWMHLSNLQDVHMEDLTSEAINEWILEKKKWFASEEYAVKGRGRAQRCNLFNELNLLRTIFNWYKAEDFFENESKAFTSPLRPRHKKMAFIKACPKKPEDKKIPVDAAFKFFSALSEPYRDLAMLQFYCAGRISEAAGVQIPNIDLERDFFLIKDVISWCNDNKRFEYLKPYPKNREPRRVHIHAALRDIIERRLRHRHPGCDYLFHVAGKPLDYFSIQGHYRRAQQKAGLPYTGTHCLRHGMATLARQVGGRGLDSVVAMTGHKDLKLADHYSKISAETQKETSLRVLEHIRSLHLPEVPAIVSGTQAGAPLPTVPSPQPWPSNVIPFRLIHK